MDVVLAVSLGKQHGTRGECVSVHVLTLVHSPHMRPEVIPACSSVGTEWAEVWLLPSVHPAVLDELFGVREAHEGKYSLRVTTTIAD